MRSSTQLAAIVTAAWLASSPSEAHLMSTGFGTYYEGLAHPLMTAEDLLPLVAMALLAGLGGARSGRSVLFVLPAAWLLGMSAGRAFAPNETASWLTPLLTIALGALVAADRKLSSSVLVGFAVVLGLVHGWLNGSGLAPAGSSLTAFLGISCTVFIVFALLAGTVVSLRRPWTRIVVRVAGSWIAAIGLLMLGWSLRMHGSLS
jgi:hydrogenase/urease accessory protein HupE